ncbi:unnamed protein product [Schistocephalus solidus]|uniref:Reverse transcriptase domain-containing protein n=1 Tax=Schistocephalus solidus TaxID=70667 RepID=A0A183SJV4_SCHSO|nr:unnamed protein product [Schistocephalus solidus]
MIRVLLQDCHARLRKYRLMVDQDKTKCYEFMGENGPNLLLQRVTERVRERRAIGDSTGEQIQNPTSPNNEKLRSTDCYGPQFQQNCLNGPGTIFARIPDGNCVIDGDPSLTTADISPRYRHRTVSQVPDRQHPHDPHPHLPTVLHSPPIPYVINLFSPAIYTRVPHEVLNDSADVVWLKLVLLIYSTVCAILDILGRYRMTQRAISATKCRHFSWLTDRTCCTKGTQGRQRPHYRAGGQWAFQSPFGRTDDLRKAEGLLEDRQASVSCATNHVKTLVGKISATLFVSENSGAISPVDRRMARAQETTLARFYGLPKMDKEGIPLWPIVSLKDTQTCGVAKWLFRCLKFLTANSDTTVSSSAQLLEKLQGVGFLPSNVMVSFDVTYLFTSIPQDLEVKTIELLLRDKYDEMQISVMHLGTAVGDRHVVA